MHHRVSKLPLLSFVQIDESSSSTPVATRQNPRRVRPNQSAFVYAPSMSWRRFATSAPYVPLEKVPVELVSLELL